MGLRKPGRGLEREAMWVVVDIMVPCWDPDIIRHLLLRVHPKGTLILTTTHVGLLWECLLFLKDEEARRSARST